MSKQRGFKRWIVSEPGERPWRIAALGESGSAVWLMESRWILESCPHPAFNLAVRGRAVEKGSRVLGVVQDPCQRKGRSQARGLVGVFFWWSSCIRCWGRLDETAVSRVHFWLARAPSQARGGLRPLSAPGRRRRRPNPHIDSLSSPLTRPPLHPFPLLKLLACGHLGTHHETCARVMACLAPPLPKPTVFETPSAVRSRPSARLRDGMSSAFPSTRRQSVRQCWSARGWGWQKRNEYCFDQSSPQSSSSRPPAITHRPRQLVV